MLLWSSLWWARARGYYEVLLRNFQLLDCPPLQLTAWEPGASAPFAVLTLTLNCSSIHPALHFLTLCPIFAASSHEVHFKVNGLLSLSDLILDLAFLVLNFGFPGLLITWYLHTCQLPICPIWGPWYCTFSEGQGALMLPTESLGFSNQINSIQTSLSSMVLFHPPAATLFLNEAWRTAFVLIWVTDLDTLLSNNY